MDITTFFKATLDYFKYLSEYPTDYTKEKKFVELVQNNNSVLEVLIQKMWQPNKTVAVGQTIWSPNIQGNRIAVVTSAGVTNSIEPNWTNDVVSDGNVEYKMYERVGSGSVSLLEAYPIGSIYISMNSTSPAVLFGGSWDALTEGRLLMSANSKYAAKSKVGADTVSLGVEQLPSHSHGGTIGGGSHSHTASCNSTGAHTHTYPKTPDTYDDDYYVVGCCSSADSSKTTGTTGSAGSHAHTITINSSSHSHTFTGGAIGGGGSHNNIMPCLNVYMWERIA